MRSDGFSVSILFILLCAIPAKAVLDPSDENFFGYTADRYEWLKHPCNRDCNIYEPARICSYVFVVEQYSTMSKACYDCPFNETDCRRPHCLPGDGSQKLVYTVNRQMPGPAIQVCFNDIINVEVRNNMMSESTTIHWHGMNQYLTPYMDGVPFVTQCPILPGGRFRYTYYATTPGTHFWHAHIGSQRGDGLYGPLTIREPSYRNLQVSLYDHDIHSMMIIDWMNKEGTDGFIKQIHETPTVLPETFLINGLGRFKKLQRNNTGPEYFTPSAVFEVDSGQRYRFRLVNAGAANCPIIMSIDNHTMLVISLDGNDVEPVEVDAITTWPGERVDFIVKANQTPNNYWIRYRGFGLCQLSKVHQTAILRYRSVPAGNPGSPVGFGIPDYSTNTRILNPYNTGTETSQTVNVSISRLNALSPNDAALTYPVDQQVYIAFDFYNLNNYDYHRKGLYGIDEVLPAYRMGSLQMNHISFKFPSFPLLSQWNMLRPDSLCNSENPPANLNCTSEHCVCTQVIPLRLNSVVEIFFIDQGNLFVVDHPIHMHGHFFRVIAEENLQGITTVDRVKQLDREGKIKRRLDRAPLKDTIKAPGGGYTIVRVHANNPGYWYFHCHFEEHTNLGMALVFKIGEHEDFPRKPDNFPVCGNYAPRTYPYAMK